MKFLSKPWAGAFVAAAMLAPALPAIAGDDVGAYPSRPIRLVVPFPPGGAADNFARLIGQRLQEAWGQPVVTDNKPGAGGQIATQGVVKSPADGYTLLVVTVGHAVNPSLYPKLPYDTEKDLKPVAAIARVPSVLVVNPSVPAKSVQELITLVKSKPGKLTYASSGNASTSHVAGAMLTSMAQLNMVHVPYRGSAPAITDLMGGQVDVMIDPFVSSAQHVKAGKLRALAISTASRSPLAPELPTLAEAGVPGYDFTAWFLMLAPSDVPAPIVKRLNEQVTKILAQPEVKEKLVQMGAEPGSGSPEQLGAFLSGEIKRLAKVAHDAGMKAE